LSKEHQKYARGLQAKRDAHQTVFGGDGAIHQKPQMTSKQAYVDFSRVVFCPFCLHEDGLQAFLVSTKEGISQSKAQCPECMNGMMMNSLVHVWTPEEYAQWVFAYARRGFWQQKCKFEQWKKRLQEKGWAKLFWDRYKELKGSSGEEQPESYTERMNRQGEEVAAEWNKEGKPDA
jgi:hypothetical protein